MNIDWELVISVVVPVATLFLGAWVTRWFEARPALVSYFGHVSAFKYILDNGNKIDIFTHSVVLRNAGRKSATNVRIRHSQLPSFEIYPPIQYEVTDLPNGGKEILIPLMVPDESITISYMYFPPLDLTGVNAGIRSDEGFAKPIPVLLQRQYPIWVNWVVGILMLVGMVASIYLIILAIRYLM